MQAVCSLTCGEHALLSSACTCDCAAGWAKAAGALTIDGCTVAIAGNEFFDVVHAYYLSPGMHCRHVRMSPDGVAGSKTASITWELTVGSGLALAASAAGSAAAAFAMCKLGHAHQHQAA